MSVEPSSKVASTRTAGCTGWQVAVATLACQVRGPPGLAREATSSTCCAGPARWCEWLGSRDGGYYVHVEYYLAGLDPQARLDFYDEAVRLTMR